MKNPARRFLVLAALLFAAGIPAFAQQYTLTQTTLSANITTGQTSFNVASATNITTAQNTNQTDIYVDRELMQVVSVNGKTVNVIRGVSGTQASAHASGAMVLAGSPPAFQNYDPEGYCNTAPSSTNPSGQGVVPPALPTINTRTSAQWLCSTVSSTWIPGFGNPGISGNAIAESASITGATVTPTGPYEKFTGTTALVTINVPTGCGGNTGCTVTLVFTGSGSGITWTAAGNINVAGTVTNAGGSVTFLWDAALAKWVPSRIS